MVARRRKHSWGGARLGSGRKPFLSDRRRVAVDLDGEDFERLEALAEERNVPIAAVMRDALKEYLKRFRRK